MSSSQQPPQKDSMNHSQNAPSKRSGWSELPFELLDSFCETLNLQELESFAKENQKEMTLNVMQMMAAKKKTRVFSANFNKALSFLAK